MQVSIAERVQKHRMNLRASGLRPVQIWVPDTRRPGFAEECHRQSLLAAQSDNEDVELQEFLEETLSDIEDWS